MKRADIALYQAKLERDRISTYDPDHDVNSVERLRLLADLRAAPAAGQMHVVYQPQVDLDNHRVLGVEALIRWDHPEHGPLRPDDFIPLAEKSGLINPLTDFVLEEALGQLARWRASGHELRMAINLSARHLGDLALPVRIWEATERHEIPPSLLVLEVTETGILADPLRANVVIRSLRKLGVEVSIDDYGTGNASLSYLRSLEVDELKVDRSFINNIATNRHDLIIVRSMIELALALGLRVVAEGIEDAPTTAALRAIGGVIGQGHHLGPPVSAEVIEARLNVQRRARGPRAPKAI
jgi:EAL domain-containing protein (putative c-di-GMP-specific phosphodiesterase class I)